MAKVKFRYLRKYIDRLGRLTYQFRRNGFRQQTIKGPSDSAEFRAAYNALRAESDAVATGQEPTPRLTAGSVDAWINRYQRSDAFAKVLSISTQKRRTASSRTSPTA